MDWWIPQNSRNRSNRLNINISALQDTRLAINGFWQRKRPKEKQELLAHCSGAPDKQFWENSPPLPFKHLRNAEHHICLCSDTESCQTQRGKSSSTAISTAPSARYQEDLDLLGDFNTRVVVDRKAWPSCLGCCGIGTISENGQRLLVQMDAPQIRTHHHSWSCKDKQFISTVSEISYFSTSDLNLSAETRWSRLHTPFGCLL